MTRHLLAPAALLVAGIVFAVQGFLLVGGADVPHALGHAAFVWGYLAVAVAVVQLARSNGTDLAAVGALLAVLAALSAVLVAVVVLLFEELRGSSTPGALHAIEAGTFLIYPALGAAGLALTRPAATRVVGSLLLIGMVLDAVIAPWVFGVCAVLAAVYSTWRRSYSSRTRLSAART